MPRYIIIEKRVGYTPLQEIELLKKSRPELSGVPLTYAGRLDPMASGKLLVLVGDECKRRSEYDKLDKEYEFEVLLGFKTDTGDMLGLPEESAGAVSYSEDDVQKVVRELIGRHTLPYPAYSSKTVRGKPLFEYALEGTLGTIDIPTANVRIYQLRDAGVSRVGKDNAIGAIIDNIQLLQIESNTGRVSADFRKDEIIARWRVLQGTGHGQSVVLKCKAIVSAGTYIRTLAPLIAERLGTQGIAYSIHRTKIGRYQPVSKYFGFWRHMFV